MQFTVVVNKSNRELRWQGASYSGRTLFLFLWKLLLFHHLLQDVCHIILVDAGSFIVLHVCVLSALRHSHSDPSCFLMIRSRTLFDGSKGFVLFSKEYKKSEPFSYRKKVRIFIVWRDGRDSNPRPTDQEKPTWNDRQFSELRRFVVFIVLS